MLTTSLEIPIEPAIAGFQSCLDPPAVLRACRDGLTRVDQSKRDGWSCARRIEALYHPGRYLCVVYALLSDPSIPSSRLWPEGQLVYLHAPLREPMSRRGTVLTIDGTAVEAYSFPNDRRLRGLRKFAGRASAVRVWQEWLRDAGSSVTLSGDSLQRLLVRYVPEQKWIVRLRAEQFAVDGKPVKHRIAVRSASPEHCASLSHRHRELSARLNSQPDAFRVPGVVGMGEDGSLLALEWIRGDSLLTHLQGGGADEIMQAMAARLHGFHATPIEGLTELTRADLSTRAAEATADLAPACPDVARDVHAVAEALGMRLADLEQPAPVMLHNDFHWNQVSIKRDRKRNRYVLHDLERMALGDPLIDVANFATQVRMLAYRPEHEVQREDAERWRSFFLRYWVEASGAKLDADRFACYAALSCLELARGMMRHLRSGWPALTRHCLEVAALHLASRTTEATGP